MNGVAYPAFIIPTAKHTGHRRNAKLLNIFTGVEMVFYIHDHLRFFAMNHKFIRARHAGAVQQSVNGKRSIARLRGVKPECGEVRELFLTVSIGIYRQPASRQAILISIIYRPEITGAQEGDDIAPRQFRRFKDTETGETEIALPFQLRRIDAGIVVFKQFRAKMNLASKMRRRINGKHAYATTKAHPYVEKLNIELPVGNTVPE
ncbi:Uncharacterised protein [Salmonella enterica subsp. enterica serovar Typhimurium str. DT104]|nr:Uncharacterised protein [Salmonella enterica subsp. enterica serovar Typhimurium str. DT104]